MHNIGAIQHAGVELLQDLRASHIYKNKPSNWPAANYLREYEAVTFGLVGIDMECYKSVKLNPKYDADLNDMDFCIRASRKGWRILYNPNSVAYHLESVTRREQGNAGKRSNHIDFAKEYEDILRKRPGIRDMQVRESEGL